MKSQGILFIVGPTASGKTSLSIQEAERRGAVILSCDSLCFYRGMDIGTAKPTADEQARVPHFGIDLEEPDTPYSVARYIEYRDQLLREMDEAGRPVVVVGGSGFYLKSFFAPVTDQIPIPESVRTHVQSLSSKGLDALVQALSERHLPDESFEGLDLKNPRRVEMALARCLASGLAYPQLRAAFAAQAPPLSGVRKEVWLIERSPGEMEQRNHQRVAGMLKDGLVEEVQQLRAAGFERNPSACGAIGYREVLDMLDGRIDPAELQEQIVIHTRQLMRKQRIWFRRQLPVGKVITP